MDPVLNGPEYPNFIKNLYIKQSDNVVNLNIKFVRISTHTRYSIPTYFEIEKATN